MRALPPRRPSAGARVCVDGLGRYREIEREEVIVRTIICALIGWVLWTSAAVHAGNTLQLALIEPLSGPFSNVGRGAMLGFQAFIDRINQDGGILGSRLELVALDNKSSAQESTLQFQAATDRGIRYILQGSGSNNGHAISDAVAKYNARNPTKPVLYFNHGALDPALTDEKCHFWHFRFVPNGHMIMNAVIDSLARRPEIKRVFLINQDYVWGHSVAVDARQLIAARRPEIRIVGDDLHPIGKVKDFAPYIAKIKAVKADAMVTGNWGNDLALLIKSAEEGGFSGRIFAPLAGLTGTPTMIGRAGAGRVAAALFWHENIAPNPLIDHALAFREKHGEDWNWLPNYIVLTMFKAAAERAGSIEPSKVAAALEDMKLDGPTGQMWMRREDHQLMLPIFQSEFTPVGQKGVNTDTEGTGFGWATEGKLDAYANVPEMRCRIERRE